MPLRNLACFDMLARTKMTETRLTLLADSNFAGLLPELKGRLAETAKSITPANFGSLLDATMRRELHLAFDQAGASEGTVWLVEDETRALVPAFNTGPNAQKMVAQFRQPLSSGLISMVYASEQPFLENEVFQNAKQDKSLDTSLNVQTYAMIAVPFYFLDACRGVISCVVLRLPGTAEPPVVRFDETARLRVSHAATVLGRLIDYRILQATLGVH
jgi:hypothetical protein